MVILDIKIVYKNQPIHKDMYLFFLNNYNWSLENSDIKCVKSLFSRFPAKSSKEALENWSESKNTMLLIIIYYYY